ncbi:MAG: anti-sigma regulatory factor [Clostridiales bacterium]|nr:anti-sigma regulatory factor [Clostridiales bacterium]
MHPDLSTSLCNNSEVEPLIKHAFHISANDFVSAGEASQKIKNILKQIGVNSELVRRIAIASYEAEMNLVIHSNGGELLFLVTPSEIQLITEDTGPGIPDIELAMKEGYSTASQQARELGFGAGMGLPNIQRNADTVDIRSEVGQGTILKITFKI